MPSFPVAIGRAISTASGTCLAGPLVDSLKVCSDVLDRSAWPDVAWRFSGLTSDGCPLEFTFSSADNRMRFTTDAAPTETANRERLNRVLDLAGVLGAADFDPGIVERIRRVQGGVDFRWGAWLGVREGTNGLKSKIYAEVPPDARAGFGEWMEAPLAGSIPVVLGHESGTTRLEIYFQQRHLSPFQFDHLLCRTCDGRSGQALRDGIPQLTGLPLESTLQWTPLGYSCIWEPSSRRCRGLALLARSQAAGGSARVCRRMLNAVRNGIRERSFYYGHFSGIDSAVLPDHGIVSLSLTESGAVELRAGISAAALAHSGRLVPARPRTQ